MQTAGWVCHGLLDNFSHENHLETFVLRQMCKDTTLHHDERRKGKHDLSITYFDFGVENKFKNP